MGGEGGGVLGERQRTARNTVSSTRSIGVAAAAPSATLPGTIRIVHLMTVVSTPRNAQMSGGEVKVDAGFCKKKQQFHTDSSKCQTVNNNSTGTRYVRKVFV